MGIDEPLTIQGVKGPITFLVWAPITCSGETHYVGVDPHGHFVMSHHDLRAERVGRALGGDLNPCVQEYVYLQTQSRFAGAEELFRYRQTCKALHERRASTHTAVLTAIPPSVGEPYFSPAIFKRTYVARLAGRLFFSLPETQDLLARLAPGTHCLHAGIAFAAKEGHLATFPHPFEPYKTCVHLLLPVNEHWFRDIYHAGTAIHPQYGLQIAHDQFISATRYAHGTLPLFSPHTLVKEEAW